jgi:sensor domain CHASE-containing protein
MAPFKYYSYDYELGTSPKKREYESYESDVKPNKVVPKPKTNLSKRSKTRAVIWVLSMFVIFMVVIYRYNIINEKNLQVQGLKNKLGNVESNLATSQIALEQSTDLKYIESYAKQKLGMQKPDKNQMIYIDNSGNDSIQKTEENTTVIDTVINGVKEFINKIF